MARQPNLNRKLDKLVKKYQKDTSFEGEYSQAMLDINELFKGEVIDKTDADELARAVQSDYEQKKLKHQIKLNQEKIAKQEPKGFFSRCFAW